MAPLVLLLLAITPTAGQVLNGAVGLKAWGSVKDAVRTVGKEAMDIESVRSDMGMLQHDLKTQEQLWHQGEQQMVAENDELRKQVSSLQAQVRAGAGVLQRVKELETAVKDETRHKDLVAKQRAHDKAQQDLEQKFLQERRYNLSSYLTKLNESAKVEVQKDQEQQMQLETDGVALRVRAAELEAMLRDNFKRLQVQTEKDDLEVKDLERQLTMMQEASVKLQGQLSQGPTQAQVTAMEQNLDQESHNVASLVALKTAAVAACDMKQAKIKQALSAEEAKLAQQKSTTSAFCSTVQNQNVALQGLVSACEGSAR